MIPPPRFGPSRLTRPLHRTFQPLAWALIAYTIILTSTIGRTGVAAAAETGTNVPAFVVKSWRTIEGLPQNTVMALAQTPDGYLWLGTQGGLARFDGVRFTTYGLADGLKAASIRCLAEDGQGGLWIGTIGGGLTELSLLGPDFRYFVGAARGNPRKCLIFGRQKHL